METATQRFHRATSYDLVREWDDPFEDELAVKDFVSNDIERLPWFFKRYAGDLPRVELPADLPVTEADAVVVMSGTAGVDPKALDLEHLSRLLHLSAGVVRQVERPYGIHPFRAAGSAGARFPMELYVCIPDGGELPPGVHWYDALEHALVTVGPPPKVGAPTVVVTGVPWRTGWRYRERGYRHIYWDTGTMLSQLQAAADAAGIPFRLFTRFHDEAVAALVGADRTHEFPVALVALGEGSPAIEASGPGTPGEIDAAPVELPLVVSAQRAGESETLGRPWGPGEPVDPAIRGDEPIDEIILARGSMRRMDRTRGLSREMFETSMALAMRGVDIPHFVVVHDVTGIQAGVYRWPAMDAAIRTGDLRDDLYRVCLQQGLGRDAAFVVISATDISALDDHAYREAQLGAGLVEGRLHLLAYALGAAASGMTFVDSEIPGLLGEELDGLLFTCVGVPEYRSRRGGRPGQPAEVKMVMPRFDDQ